MENPQDRNVPIQTAEALLQLFERREFVEDRAELLRELDIVLIEAQNEGLDVEELLNRARDANHHMGYLMCEMEDDDLEIRATRERTALLLRRMLAS